MLRVQLDQGGTLNYHIKYQTDIENLLLLCRDHHKLVDNKPEIYTVEKLRAMKIKHEREIHRLCDLMYYPKCIVVKVSISNKG